MARKFEINFLEDYTKDSLLGELRRIQSIIGDRPVTQKDIDQHGKAAWSTYFRKFGGFSKALILAGLKTSRRMNVSDKELIDAVISLWTQTLEKEGRRPFSSDLKKYSAPYSQDTYRRRFGTWKKALVLAYNSEDKNELVDENSGYNLAQEKEKPQSRKEISVRKRFLVFRRDQFTCIYCGRSGVGIKLEVDHKIPVSKGGNNILDNLQTLCYDCNRGKRADVIIK